MLDVVERVRRKSGLSDRQVCNAIQLPYSSFRRWQERRARGLALLNHPGPKKALPLNLALLEGEIDHLGHCDKLSFGTTRLWRLYHDRISRREFQRLVRKARQEIKRGKRERKEQIQWLQAGLIWAMDASEYEERDSEGQKVHLQQIQDLASRYKFQPMAGDYPDGEGIAGHLQAQINRYGAPLFLKRDNGGNENHSMVDEVMAENGVIPLNSPAYYAPYNGGIEEAQRETKQEIRKRLSRLAGPCPQEHFEVYAEAAVHDLNHKQRGILKGKTACRVFFENKGKVRFSKQERRVIYEHLIKLKMSILAGMGKSDAESGQVAWRIAVESWLEKKGYIEITRPEKSVTHL